MHGVASLLKTVNDNATLICSVLRQLRRVKRGKKVGYLANLSGRSLPTQALCGGADRFLVAPAPNHG